LRPTAQRLAVLAAITGAPSAVTAQELHYRLREGGSRTGLTTVYRTLSALAEARVLDRFENAGEQSFRLCGAAHHHHLVCLHCGSVRRSRGPRWRRGSNARRSARGSASILTARTSTDGAAAVADLRQR